MSQPSYRSALPAVGSPGRARLLAGIALFVLYVTTGCGTAGRVTVSPPLDRELTPDEQQEAERITAAMQRLCEWAREAAGGRQRCEPPRILAKRGLMLRDPYDPTRSDIVIAFEALGPEADRYRPAVAHELAHRFWTDAHTNCGPENGRRLACEDAANVNAIQALIVGFGYTLDDAIDTMRRYLVEAVTAKTKPSPGHPDYCRELHAYEREVAERLRRMGHQPQSQLYPCDEQAR